MARNPETPQDRENKAIIKQRLNRLLLANHTTQAKLSDDTHIPRSTLTGYFKGTTTPNATNVAKLASFFGVNKGAIDPRYVQTGTTAVDLADDQPAVQYQGRPLSRAELQLVRRVLEKARQ